MFLQLMKTRANNNMISKVQSGNVSYALMLKFFHENGNRDRNGMALPTSVMSQTTTVPARLNSFAVRQCEEINTITSNGNTTDKSLAAVQGNISRTRVDI